MRDLTAQQKAAIEAKSGTAVHVLVELELDSPVGNASPGQASYITWVSRDTSQLSKVRVLARLDGNDWEKCTNGGPIPGIENGRTYAGRTVHVRTLFLMDGSTRQSPELLSLNLQIYFDDGATLWEHEESTYAELRNATLRGVEAVNDTAAVVRLQAKTGANFAGGGGRIWVPPSPTFNPSELPTDPALAYDAAVDSVSMSLEGWFYINAFVGDTNQTICTFRTGVSFEVVNDARALVVWLPPSTAEWGLVNGVFQSLPRDTLVTEGWFVISASNVIQALTWNHLAFVWTGNVARLYLNGSLVAARAFHNGNFGVTGGGDVDISKPPSIRKPPRVDTGEAIPDDVWALETSRGLVVGEQYNGDYPFHGKLDELRVWQNRALTSGDIITHMTRSLTSAERTRFGVSGDGTLALELGLDSTHADTSGHNQTTHIIQPEGDNEDITFETFAEPWGTVPPDDPTTGEFNGFINVVGYRDTRAVIDVQGERCVRASSTIRPIVWDGKTFLGVAHLGNVSAVTESAGTELTGLQFTVGAVTDENGETPLTVGQANLAIALAEQYINRPARMWIVLFDVNDAMVGDPILVYQGRMDTMPITLGADWSISITTEHWLRDWERPSSRRWAHQYQLKRYPGDQFFSHVQEVLEKQIWWPGEVDLS